MAIQGATQALIAAFSFGIVVNAASAALFLYLNGNGSAIFRDGLRLVLVIFLLSSALWAQVGFIATVIDSTDSTMPCQIGVIFTSLFDQLGRFSIEQYLLWAMNSGGGGKLALGQLIPQLVVLARFVAGLVFVGFSRPQVDSVCVPMSSMSPIAAVVIGLDGFIIAMLAARAFMTGIVSDIQESKSSAGRSKLVVLVMVGFAIWTGTSVAMILGMPETEIVIRTTVPAIGLFLLILVVTGGMDALVTPRNPPSHPPEAPSPRQVNITRDLSSADSDYPPSRYEDLKEQAVRSSATFLQPREAPRVSQVSKGTSNIGNISGPLGGNADSENAASGRPWMVGIGSLKRKNTERSAKNVRLAIGNPILDSNDSHNPLNKIATIDLQEAAKAEKERRTVLLKGESGAPSSQQPAPQPSELSPTEALKRSTSFKRKNIASVSSSQQVVLTPSAQRIVSTASGSASLSAQRSPGADELRRRSPRRATQDSEMEPMPVSGRLSPPEATPPSSTSNASSDPVSTQEATNSTSYTAVRPAIRPSRKLSDPPKEEDVSTAPPEPRKTMLQRRPTNGLPGNPRARANNDGPKQTEQTVMFVNDIVYDDPTAVQNIIDGASNKAASKMPPPRPNAPGVVRASSVVNRPRPIPRKSSEDAVNHRRSKSGGSLISRKSLLMSSPGSPSQLPPLPPPPKSAGGFPSRPQPNKTKSMTVDEKMKMFFPAPPNSGGKQVPQMLEAPALPPIPASFLQSSNSPANHTSRTSQRTESVFDVDEIQPKESRPARPADDFDGSWLPAIPSSSVNQKSKTQRLAIGGKDINRGSSPLIPPPRVSAWTETTDARQYDDSPTTSSPAGSPRYAVEIPAAQRMAKESKFSVSARGSEEVGFMLDDSSRSYHRERKSWLAEDDNSDISDSDDDMVKSKRTSQWHRRIGDNLPTFSERTEKRQSARMPPPTPLSLNPKFKRGDTVVIHTAEPSPIESPQQAIHQIQSQLKKFDDPRPASNASPGQRLALLENLEKEMGMQEDRWHEMQHDITRDSVSTIRTSPNRSSMRESILAGGDLSSLRPSLARERMVSRQSGLRSSTTSKSTEDSTPELDSSRVSVWQQRLAEAQTEYIDTVSEQPRGLNTNFVALTKAQLGSPTPPDTDDSDDGSRGLSMAMDSIVVRAVPPKQESQKSGLWTSSAAPTRPAGFLWTPVPQAPKREDAELPGLSVRLATRKAIEPLHIHSARLWSKPHNTQTRSAGGLWRPIWAARQPSAAAQPKTAKSDAESADQKPPRPLTQRPPRRNKRLTLLPDIVENPEPLPDKRGTLGIFQFPWGERSDTAAVQPTGRSTMVMAMPGTMASGGLAAKAALERRAKQIEEDEYSSSFFDDYDEDSEEDDDAEGAGDSEEDDFDETTLWEIASLLKTDSVPSKFSLLPAQESASPGMARYSVDKMPQIPESSGEQPAVIALADSSRTVQSQQNDRKSALWNAPPKPKTSGTGLPHPDEETWEKYGGDIQTARAKPRKADPAQIESDTLWAADSSSHDHGHDSGSPLWKSNKQQSTKIPRPAKQAGKQREKGELSLWKASAVSDSVAEQSGLFEINNGRSQYRTTTEEPAAKNMVRKPRAASNDEPLQRLNSNDMWTKTRGRKGRFQQTSHGLWDRPASMIFEQADGLFAVDRTRSEYRTTSQEPAAKNMQRKPRPSEFKPLDQLASAGLWASADESESADRNWIVAKPEHKKPVPIRQQYRRPLAYRADWEAALQEALAASYPLSTLARRVAATEAEWTAALEEAITLGSRPYFDPAVRHPVFAAPSSLTTTSESFHPAATGYTHDVAAVHPVFFGSAALPREEDGVAHPAMSTDASRKERRQEILAHIHAVEDETETIAATLEHTAPADPQSDLLRAQIEALEQEKLFAQQAVVDLRLRQSIMGVPASIPQQQQLWEQNPPELFASEQPPTLGMWAPPTPGFQPQQQQQPVASPSYLIPLTEYDAGSRPSSSMRRREDMQAQPAGEPAIGVAETTGQFSEQGVWGSMEEANLARLERNWLSEPVYDSGGGTGVTLRY